LGENVLASDNVAIFEDYKEAVKIKSCDVNIFFIVQSEWKNDENIARSLATSNNLISNLKL